MIPGLAKKALPFVAIGLLVWAWANEHNERVKEIGAAEFRAAEARAQIRVLKPEVVILTKEVHVKVQDVLTQGRRYKAAKEELARAIPPDSLPEPVTNVLVEADSAVSKSIALATASQLAIETMKALIEALEKERDAFKDLMPTFSEKLRTAGFWAGIGAVILAVLQAVL